MSIGPDIEEVIDELGITATIIRSPVNLTEKITYDVNEQATNQFIREFLLNVSLRHNSVIVCGDTLQFNSGTYLVIHKTPDSFEGEVVENVSVVLKCNLPSSSLILKPIESVDQTTFEVTSGWSVRTSVVYGLIHNNISGAVLNKDAGAGKETTFKLESIVPASYEVCKLDRIYLSSTEYYRVEYVEKWEFPSIHVLTLVEDDRIAYVP